MQLYECNKRDSSRGEVDSALLHGHVPLLSAVLYLQQRNFCHRGPPTSPQLLWLQQKNLVDLTILLLM